jgi:anaerobic selenocysteine-containing dehydrogenase
MSETRRSFCRCCINRCALIVELEDGRVQRVRGDRDDPMFRGYTCVKGRAQGDLLRHPDRLLHSLKRGADGRLSPIPVDAAIGEIAERIVEIRDRFGPRAVAGYWGTMATGVLGGRAMFSSLLRLIGSPMEFGPETLDKGGKHVAHAALGRWMAPSTGFDRPEVALLIGSNPLVTYTGLPNGSPSVWLRERFEHGMKLVVIDPRRSEVAAKAHLHLQPLPGHDTEILAAMIRVVVTEDLVDHEFVRENVSGVDELREAVAPFTPQRVAASAGLRPGEIEDAARMFAAPRRGFAFAGTGPHMTGRGSLAEYLTLVLETLCGHWLRAGEDVVAAPTLLPRPVYKAQAEPPTEWSTGAPSRMRGLTGTGAGMPSAALAEEILTPGEGQVRALLSWNGNPVLAFPNQLKTIDALRTLDLFVHVDPFLTPSAQLAHYVIAPTMPLEATSATLHMDAASMRSTGYGSGLSYANYTPAVVAPVEDSDVVHEWEFFLRLYDEIEHALRGAGVTVPARPAHTAVSSDEELLRVLTNGSRVPLDQVVQRGRGDLYPDPDAVVLPKDPGWTGRLDVGNRELLQDLAEIARDGQPRGERDSEFPFRLLCRRMNHVYNSSHNIPATHRGKPYNPAFMHPDDLSDLGLASGALAVIESAVAGVPAVIEADPTLLRGTVSMAFGYGGGPEVDGAVREIGSSPARLVAQDEVFDPYIGQPRMTNVPVAVTPMSDLSAGD